MCVPLALLSFLVGLVRWKPSESTCALLLCHLIVRSAKFIFFCSRLQFHWPFAAHKGDFNIGQARAVGCKSSWHSLCGRHIELSQARVLLTLSQSARSLLLIKAAGHMNARALHVAFSLFSLTLSSWRLKRLNICLLCGQRN